MGGGRLNNQSSLSLCLTSSGSVWVCFRPPNHSRCFNRVPRASLVILALLDAQNKTSGPMSGRLGTKKC